MMFKKIRRSRWIYLERKRIRKTIINSSAPWIIIGAGQTSYKNWIKTDYPFFDITSEKQWTYFFKSRKAKKILCEHVLEHFTPEQNKLILKLVYKNLEKGGNIRIAVPDKNHPDPNYINYVKPGGYGTGSDDHKSFWDYKTYSNLLEEIGFKVELLEFCDVNKNLNAKKYDLNNGVVNRSYAYDYKGNVENYSSLIVDAMKVE